MGVRYAVSVLVMCVCVFGEGIIELFPSTVVCLIFWTPNQNRGLTPGHRSIQSREVLSLPSSSVLISTNMLVVNSAARLKKKTTLDCSPCSCKALFCRKEDRNGSSFCLFFLLRD